ncbi:GLPGLI family protein [Flavobacterium sp.]|uniref:GLPGLI family protein n=1 Tax=Flavobacterium sp. TaxID=239 RepID=UPI0026260ED5|nr:GLPGLI family protein [Flavobacterium sp.]
MKRYIFILLTSIGMNQTITAQTSKITYEEQANIENQLKNVTDPATRERVSKYLSQVKTFTLYYKDGISLYNEQNANDTSDKDSGLSESSSKFKTVNIGKKSGGIYKNQKTNEYLQEADLLGKAFLVSDKLDKISWKLINETKKIGEFNCKKATAVVNGENVTAWYAPSLPINDGPKDYWGLPGLIIDLTTDTKTYHAIKVTSIAQFDFEKPSKGQKISKENYIKDRNEKVDQLKRGMGNVLNQN